MLQSYLGEKGVGSDITLESCLLGGEEGILEHLYSFLQLVKIFVVQIREMHMQIKEICLPYH